MYKRFTAAETVSNKSQAKTSVARAVRAAILEQYPLLEGPLEEIWPAKKALVELLKCRNNTTLVAVEGRVLFFQVRDGPWIPHLKFLHQHPGMMPTVQVDTGAIKHVLAGSDIMDPGLTSAGGRLPDDEHALPVGTPVCILAEGKSVPMAVGTLLQSTQDIRRLNEGKGITNLHYIGDGLYAYSSTSA